ncbi:MAG TPA: sulfatase [Chthonomonadaceae bacterium]|nr:sulfatase [Chthonomonadaceae bacterium]
MRVLYIDIDSLRPDHLGCYGYHRDTSPNIDAIARSGARFDNVYTPDAPCLPSRTALWSGRHGLHTGVINHGGAAAEPFLEGAGRGFRSRLGATNWMTCLRQAGYHTATISPFGERHSAWHWYAGFNEVHNTGKGGMESAEEISPVALDWIARNGRRDGWFLHVNFWDPHTPYRAPADFGEPFADTPLPAWLTEEVRQRHWEGCGPHSAQEMTGFTDADPWQGRFPRQPVRADSMAAVRRMLDGYDAGVRYADLHVGRILNALADANLLDETAVVISSDHGENLGELNIYGDHQTADQITCRIPLLVRWPGHPHPLSNRRRAPHSPSPRDSASRPEGSKRGDVEVAANRPADGKAKNRSAGRVDGALHYHFDFAATLIELAGGTVPDLWDGESFADAFRKGEAAGRDALILSQGAWSCQRAVRWDDTLCLRSYHDGYHAFPDVMLFDVKNDPHEQQDLAGSRPDLVREAAGRLEAWNAAMKQTATHPQDPMQTVLAEGGPLHTRGHLPAYLERLRATGRNRWAEVLAAKHPEEI